MTTEGGEWEAATWEGSRRLALKKALRRTVRERLEALEALAETSERLARIGRERRQAGDVGGGGEE